MHDLRRGAVDDAQRIAERAAQLAAEADRNRRLAPELVDAIAEAGLFRLCVPRELGGLEAEPATLARAVEALAAGDGAAGWCLAIGATSGVVAGYLPAAGANAVYGPPRAISGGVFAPKGRAVAVDGGFRVSGRWPFASGCGHCDWLMGGAVVELSDGLAMQPNGTPDVRLMLAPAAEVEIIDTWHVTGLRGTGSHDIAFADLFVPAEHSASVFTDLPRADGPLYAFPLFSLLAIAIAAAGLGIARGALDDLVVIAQAKTPTGSRRRLAERASAQAGVARAEAALRSARAFLLDSIEQGWEDALEFGEVPVERRRAIRLACSHSAETAAEVAASAYRIGGASSIYESSPLERRFRDATVAAQHMLVAPATFELAGRLALGLATDVSQL